MQEWYKIIQKRSSGSGMLTKIIIEEVLKLKSFLAINICEWLKTSSWQLTENSTNSCLRKFQSKSFTCSASIVAAINLIFDSSWLLSIWELAKNEQFTNEILLNLMKIREISVFRSSFTKVEVLPAMLPSNGNKFDIWLFLVAKHLRIG